MSSYGPPGGSDPGEQPWTDGPPSDPWGDQAESAQPQPVGVPPVSPDPPAIDPRQTVLLVVVAALALLLGIGGFTAFWFSDGLGGAARPASSPTSNAATEAAATAVPTGEFRAISVGQCMVNDGTDVAPQPRLVACAPGTYEVLRRFDGTVDYARNCATVPGYQFHFFYDSNLDTLDFVLCMRKR